MRRLKRSWKWAFLCLLLVACGGKSNEASSTTDDDSAGNVGNTESTSSNDTSTNSNKLKSCQDLCDSAQSCGAAQSDCAKSCADNLSLSQVGQEAISNCLTNLPCEPSESDLLGSLLCVNLELGITKLTAQQSTFCSDTAKRAQACGDAPADDTFGDCSTQAALLSDEILSGINDCQQSNCDELQSCVFNQVLQVIDFGSLIELTSSSDPSSVNVSTITDLLVLLALSNQLGLSSELPLDGLTDIGVGGAQP